MSDTKLPPPGSQSRQIYEILKSGGTITAYHAATELGILCLAQRIYDLQNKYNITIYTKTAENKAKGRHWTIYSMKPFEAQNGSL
ncbi:MAG: helix-turn-helix domain-containing protein [Sulfurovaceae bacterium]|nr:helix-turn-helix domain-containing protein [Sulfurovaceae bacterium]